MRKHLIMAVSALALLSPTAFAQTSGGAEVDAEADVGVGSGNQVLPTTENSADAGANADIGADVDVGAEADAGSGGLLDGVADTTGDALDATGDAIGNAVDATGEAIDNTTDAAGDMMSGGDATAEGAVETDAEAVVGATTGAAAGVSTDAEGVVEAGILETLSPDDLIGKSVQSPDGETVGEVTEIMGAPGGAQQILVTTGGFLGIGAKTVILEPSMLMFDSTTDVVVVNMTEAELKALPEFEG